MLAFLLLLSSHYNSSRPPIMSISVLVWRIFPIFFSCISSCSQSSNYKVVVSSIWDLYFFRKNAQLNNSKNKKHHTLNNVTIQTTRIICSSFQYFHWTTDMQCNEAQKFSILSILTNGARICSISFGVLDSRRLSRLLFLLLFVGWIGIGRLLNRYESIRWLCALACLCFSIGLLRLRN